MLLDFTARMILAGIGLTWALFLFATALAGRIGRLTLHANPRKAVPKRAPSPR